MAFGKWGKYVYPCVLKDNNLIFLDGSKKQSQSLFYNSTALSLFCHSVTEKKVICGDDHYHDSEYFVSDTARKREKIHRDRLAIK
ncbi:hypothetical protein ACJMK2_003271 [Sinanodonta woodiana]|uniref:Uncharacterized protein n=1 Tax=Sinanodonta woodiana TaxID=1069815 RepID=A0ABD3XXV8_SINWO